MTIQKIKVAAFKNFAENGYNGGSLAQIAEEVGIKKQSIYTYFKSKDVLYTTLSKEAMEFELAFIEQFFEDNKKGKMEKILFQLLHACEKRFAEQVLTKFFLRSAFFPPPHLEKQLMEHVYYYLDSLEQQFTHYFKLQSIAVSPQEAAISYLALLDSLFVEMLYGGHARFEKRLQASWTVFYRGLTYRGETS
ncbi:TetR/AcrR family transcriptional regulator [Solibacillus cecembensis]|uniref:TetR/AcrR family transcriptional regulator n=1 Tax=Solibacillus cecembensis TaxID=459347 RepID=UPI003CFF26D6